MAASSRVWRAVWADPNRSPEHEVTRLSTIDGLAFGFGYTCEEPDRYMVVLAFFARSRRSKPVQDLNTQYQVDETDLDTALAEVRCARQESGPFHEWGTEPSNTRRRMRQSSSSMGQTSGDAEAQKAQAKRDFFSALEDNQPLKKMMRIWPDLWVRYRQLVFDWRKHVMPPTQRPDVPPTVILYYGPSGCGKSRTARQDFGDQEYHVMHPSMEWADGYDPSIACSLIEEFSGAASKCPLERFLMATDRYPYQHATKGGWVWYMPSTIAITMMRHPSEVYKFGNRQELYLAIVRRITTVVVFDRTPSGSFTERRINNPGSGFRDLAWEDFWKIHRRDDGTHDFLFSDPIYE